MRPTTRKFFWPGLDRFVVIVLAILIANAALAADHDETVDGDLSGDPANPTPITVDMGNNVVTGRVTDSPLDRDFLTLSVPDGLVIEEIRLTQFDLLSAPSDGGMLVALEMGNQITDLDSSANLRGFVIAGVAAGTQQGDDLLDDLGGAPLSAGEWTLWLQNTGSVTDYQLTVVASAISAPAAVASVPVLGPVGLLMLALAMVLVVLPRLREARD